MKIESDKRNIKKFGQYAAKEWIKTATPKQLVDFAASGFKYGALLHDSPDPDFSYAFFKQVKSHVFCKLRGGENEIR